LDDLQAAEVVAALHMEFLEGEGVWIAPIYRSDHGSAIYALLTPEGFSALHLLDEDELWVHVAGAPVRMLLLHPDGSIEEPTLGCAIGPGQGSTHLVPAGTWQGSSVDGPWALVVCSLAPPFSGLTLADATTDLARWASAGPRIRTLMRD
jgi:predicted cupin superfamily sugar epimerase